MSNQDPYIAQELLSHQAFLRRLAFDLVGKDADDLVQDVWQRALERPPHHGRQLRGWLARVARNLAANRWRGEARRRSREERAAGEQPALEDVEARLELRMELVGALNSLSPSCRETILLRYFEGLAPGDIARRQGTPVATVKTRLRRGLGQLREALDKRHGGDRATWMSALTALGAPVGNGPTTGTLVIGGIAMGTMMKMSAAILVAAVGTYLVTRTPGGEAQPVTAVTPPAADGEVPEPIDAAVVTAAMDPARSAVGRSPVAEEPPGGVPAAPGSNVLRVILEGVTEEDARMTTVTLTCVDKRAFNRKLATAEQGRAYVQWIQESLNHVLGTRLAVDGQLGLATRRAIRDFQQREGLPTDGRSVPETERALIQHVGMDSYAPQWPAEIRDSWRCQGSTTEFDLNPFLASVAAQQLDLRVDELAIQIDHPLHLIERTRVTLSRGVERESGEMVHEVRVRLVPAAVIHGRLARKDGASAARGLVGALLLEEDFPIEGKGRAVECAEDGAFDLRVGASGLYALASFEEGRRPTTLRVEAVVGTRVDVGTSVLEPGHTITGHVLLRGNPVAGASVSVVPPTSKTAAASDAVESGMYSSVYEGRTFTSPARSVSLLWLTPTTTFSTRSGSGSRRGGRFELMTRRDWQDTDENGSFAFGGLGTGEYLVSLEGLSGSRTAPGSWDAPDEMVSIHGGTPGLVVGAPEHGVVLDFRWASIRFEFTGDLEREDEGRLVLRTPSGIPLFDSTGKDLRAEAEAKGWMFPPDYYSNQFALSGDEPTFVLQALPGKHMTGEITFPGREPVPLDFLTPEPGDEVVVPIELLRGEVATLVIELEHSQAELPETFTVKLWDAGQNDDPPSTREVELASGKLRVDGMLPGVYRVRVRPGEDRYYASGLFFDNEFEVELHPGVEVTRSIPLREGAGMRVTVRGDDGELVSGQYDFFDDTGRPVHLVLGTDLTDTSDGSISSWSFDSYPVHTSLDKFEPGRYRLVLLSAGYAEQSVTVDLRAGEYEDVVVTLSR